MDKYYVQMVAQNYLKNVINKPCNVHDKFLHSLTKEEFADGFNELTRLICQLYSDIAKTPADFNMTLKKAEDAKSTDYANSNASFLRMPNLLLLLGATSSLESNGVLTVDCGLLLDNAKKLKITGLPFLLSKLKDYGFDISDFGKVPKTGESLTVVYIDNRYLTTALKSMADALLELTKGDLRNSKNDYFYLMNPALLENETVIEPNLDMDSFSHVLTETQRDCVSVLHRIVADITKHSVHLGQLMRNDWSCTYTNKKSKKVLMKLLVEQSNLSVKLNLQNINQYISVVDDMPEKIQNSVCNDGWECGKCNPRCAGGFAFEMNGTAHNKCHCGSFVFGDLTDEDLKNLEKLLILEMKA